MSAQAFNASEFIKTLGTEDKVLTWCLYSSFYAF